MLTLIRNTWWDPAKVASSKRLTRPKVHQGGRFAEDLILSLIQLDSSGTRYL